MMEAIVANLREYWMVHALLTLYTVMLAHHAWTGNRATKGLADYYVGGRRMGGWVLGLSFFATYASTNSFVGFSGRTYDWGLPWLLFIPTAVAFSLFAWIVVAPRLREFTQAMDSLTIPDFIGFRFRSTTARVLAAVIVIVASFFYMTAVFKGIGALLEQFLDIPYRVSIGIVFLIVMLYTMIGGFISVVKTDTVQGVVMLFAAIILFSGTVDAAGGLGALREIRTQPESAPLFTWGGGVAIPVLLGTMFSGLVKFAVEPRQLSRFFALEGARAIRTGMIVSSLTFAVVFSLLIPVGIYARAIIPTGLEGDTDFVVPTLLTDVFGPGPGAFLLVSMVAAAMSSLDSVLLVMASTTERDIVSVLRPGRSEHSGDGVDEGLGSALRRDHRGHLTEGSRGNRRAHRLQREPVRSLLLPGHRARAPLAAGKRGGGDRFFRGRRRRLARVAVRPGVRDPARGLPGDDPLAGRVRRCGHGDARRLGRSRPRPPAAEAIAPRPSERRTCSDTRVVWSVGTSPSPGSRVTP